MKNGLGYMLLGVGLGMGALASYQQYRNGNLKRAYDKMTNQAQKGQGNMM